jgi:predicted AAA+ superfamily ATPase
MGKSSLVKAAHAEVCREKAKGKPEVKLVEIHREDIASLPACLAHMRASSTRFIVFCDDLSFDKDDTSYKSLKACWRVASRAGPRTCCSTPPPTADT